MLWGLFVVERWLVYLQVARVLFRVLQFAYFSRSHEGNLEDEYRYIGKWELRN